MGTDNILDFGGREEISDPLTELIRKSARKMIAAAIEEEVAVYLEENASRRSSCGHAGVVRNGCHPERSVQTGIGPMSVLIPKVRSKDGAPVTFRSALVPPYVRKTKSLEAAVPWLYLKGVFSGEMEAALQVLVGPEARGLSASTVSRMKQEWEQEYEGWRERRVDKDEWVYIWADGIYSGLRDDENKLCALVIIGVTARGEKKFLAIEDGVRESTQSWREVLLPLKERGMNVPKLAIGDGALGFWAALEKYSHKRDSNGAGCTKR